MDRSRGPLSLVSVSVVKGLAPRLIDDDGIHRLLSESSRARRLLCGPSRIACWLGSAGPATR